MFLNNFLSFGLLLILCKNVLFPFPVFPYHCDALFFSQVFLGSISISAIILLFLINLAYRKLCCRLYSCPDSSLICLNKVQLTQQGFCPVTCLNFVWFVLYTMLHLSIAFCNYWINYLKGQTFQHVGFQIVSLKTYPILSFIKRFLFPWIDCVPNISLVFS